MTSLNLDLTNVSDVSPLSGLTNLSSLSLALTDVSDISPLVHLSNLVFSDSTNIPVSDLRSSILLDFGLGDDGEIIWAEPAYTSAC